MPGFFSDQATTAALAGAAGGIVRWFTVRDKIWPDGIINVAVGAICALYLNPIVLPLMEPVIGKLVVEPTEIAGLTGFMIGIGGLSVSGFIIDFWRTRRRLLDKNGGDNDD